MDTWLQYCTMSVPQSEFRGIKRREAISVSLHRRKTFTEHNFTEGISVVTLTDFLCDI